MGCDHVNHDAAVLHAQRIAAELAKAGEFFRAGVVFVARAALPGSPSCCRDEGPAAAPPRSDGRSQSSGTGRFPALASTENP
ncbi:MULTISPECIES: hypothetical protein [Bradyrhizobium]|uniref:hypothetical protein n=1 Tax=Bradyrhizobium TaxID=374 RepID=UPI00361CA622